ncbi:hypothetical protein ACHWQZ_G019502 [Mnemiopsis leidyi]
MIIRYLPNGCRKVSNLLNATRCLSATSTTSVSAIKDQNFLGEILSPENQLAKLHSTSVITEPSSVLDQFPYMYQNALDILQISTGLPWWGVLVGAGIAGRLVTLPAHVQLEKSMMAKLPVIRLQKEALISKISGDLVASIKRLKEAESLRKTEGIPSSFTLLKYFLPGCCVLALNFSAVYGLSEMNYLPLLNTPFLWIQSLCLSDPHRVLSFVNALMISAIAKRYVLSLPDSEKSAIITAHKKKWFLFTFCALAAQATLPASVLIYWSASNLTRLYFIDTLLRLDLFRTKVGLVEYSEKLAAYGSLPIVDTTPKAVQLVGSKDAGNVVPNEASIRENELAKLWKEGDLEVLKSTIEVQKKLQSDSTAAFEEDLSYCEEELKNMPLLEKLSSPLTAQLTTQQKLLQDKIAGAEKSKSRLETMERKIAITERKQKFQYMLSSEEEGEYEVLKSDLLETHSNLLDELEECEKELSKLQSEKMQHYERYAKRQKLLDLQRSLLDDIEFCEKEIVHLPRLKSKADVQD